MKDINLEKLINYLFKKIKIMKKLKLKVLALGAYEALTRVQMKNVLGGVLGGGGGSQCGSPSDSGGCKTGACTATSGDCKGANGTCGSSSHGTACTCAATC